MAVTGESGSGADRREVPDTERSPDAWNACICRHFTVVSLASVRYNVRMTETNNIRQDWLSVPRRREEERLDPHVYKRGINGLTVEEASRRAFPG